MASTLPFASTVKGGEPECEYHPGHSTRAFLPSSQTYPNEYSEALAMCLDRNPLPLVYAAFVGTLDGCCGAPAVATGYWWRLGQSEAGTDDEIVQAV
jgi:hypothetical protein